MTPRQVRLDADVAAWVEQQADGLSLSGATNRILRKLAAPRARARIAPPPQAQRPRRARTRRCPHPEARRVGFRCGDCGATV